MQRTILFIMAVAICLTATSTSVSAQSGFSVSGYGRVFYEPDSYDLSFGVTTDEPDIQKCKEAHLAALEKVKAFLDTNKDKIVSLKQHVTRLETIHRNEQRDRFFRFTTFYIARIKDAKSVMPIQEGLISAGVTDILGLDMFSTKLPELIKEARIQAIKDAKDKAELAASQLGWVLIGATDIAFGESEWYENQKASVQYGSRAYVYDPSQRPDLTTYVSSQVSITFRFEKKP